MGNVYEGLCSDGCLRYERKRLAFWRYPDLLRACIFFAFCDFGKTGSKHKLFLTPIFFITCCTICTDSDGVMRCDTTVGARRLDSLEQQALGEASKQMANMASHVFETYTRFHVSQIF